MTARAEVDGKPMAFVDGEWREDAQGRECRWCGKRQVQTTIGGRDTWIDACLLDLVHALNGWGVPTLDSCCGHGDNAGGICLADGRWLVVTDRAHALQWCGEPYDRDANG